MIKKQLPICMWASMLCNVAIIAIFVAVGFVCGLHSTGAQKKLLGKKDLTFESAVDITTAFETVELQAQDMKKHGPVTTEEVKDIEEPLLAISQNFFNFGRGGHVSTRCRFRTAHCYNCHKLGHLARMCREAQGRNFQGRRAQ